MHRDNQKKGLVHALLSALLIAVTSLPSVAYNNTSDRPVDGSAILSFGTDPSLDETFGTWVLPSNSVGSVGNKSVVRGAHFYVNFQKDGS